MAAATAGLVCWVSVSYVDTAEASSPQAPIKLTRATPRIVRVACRDAQKRVMLRVICPRLIPATRYVHGVGLWGQLDFSRSLWAITFNNGDNGPGYVHWIAGGGTVRASRYYLLRDSVNAVKGLPRLLARRTVEGYSVTIYEYPPYPAGGPNGGHTASFVLCGSREVFASVHGYGHGGVVTAMAVDLARRYGCR
jgi:hypothetical protein